MVRSNKNVHGEYDIMLLPQGEWSRCVCMCAYGKELGVATRSRHHCEHLLVCALLADAPSRFTLHSLHPSRRSSSCMCWMLFPLECIMSLLSFVWTSAAYDCWLPRNFWNLDFNPKKRIFHLSIMSGFSNFCPSQCFLLFTYDEQQKAAWAASPLTFPCVRAPECHFCFSHVITAGVVQVRQAAAGSHAGVIKS